MSKDTCLEYDNGAGVFRYFILLDLNQAFVTSE
jgi:hypothetical protein